MTVFLLGGGWGPQARDDVYGPFLDAAGPRPRIACVVYDENEGAAARFDRWAAVLTATAPCEPLPVLIPEGGRLDVAALGSAEGLLVCGGLTPAYADALAPGASAVRAWLDEGSRPYAGFSAGAAVAAHTAVVGGWRCDGVPVCPEDSAEDLDEVTVVPGLGLVPFAVDVHAAQWGTLGRLVAAVRSGHVTSGVAVDEDTLLTVDGDTAVVGGAGRVHHVRASGPGVEVTSAGTGERVWIELGTGAQT
jgi:cyanophycinase